MQEFEIATPENLRYFKSLAKRYIATMGLDLKHRKLERRLRVGGGSSVAHFEFVSDNGTAVVVYSLPQSGIMCVTLRFKGKYGRFYSLREATLMRLLWEAHQLGKKEWSTDAGESPNRD